MNLNYDFPPEVRSLFMDIHACWECGQNGSGSGGLQIHHIWGRVSASACNASLLCQKCHERVTGSPDEHIRYFLRTFRFLRTLSDSGLFKWGTTDDSFIALVWKEVSEELSTVLVE